jgi:cytochrome oxidase Cu insertion factor (SCO1/SenC/PrrC family)
MKPIWYEFRVKVEKQGESVGHTGVTYLVDDTGMQVTRYPAFTGADQFVADLEKILAPQLLVDGGIDDDA